MLFIMEVSQNALVNSMQNIVHKKEKVVNNLTMNS